MYMCVCVCVYTHTHFIIESLPARRITPTTMLQLPLREKGFPPTSAMY